MATDPVFISWGKAALTTFVVMVVLNAVIDNTRVLWSIRCQPYKPTFSLAEYADCAATALFNFSFVHWPVTLGLFKVWKNGAGPTREFDWGTAVLHVLACAIIIEVWFYWSHRLLHYGSLYRLIHKKHHRYTAPAAIVAVYAHPLEFAFGTALRAKLLFH